MQIQKLDTIIMNICILINIYSIYLLYKELLNVKLQLDNIANKLDVPKTIETPTPNVTPKVTKPETKVIEELKCEENKKSKD